MRQPSGDTRHIARRSEGQDEESRRDCRNHVTGNLLGDRKGRAGMQEVAVIFRL